MDRRGRDIVRLEQIASLEAWRYGAPGTITDIPAADLGEDNWQFADAETRALFARIRARFPHPSRTNRRNFRRGADQRG